MAMKAGFLEKLIGRLGKIGPEEVQNYLLRLAQEKGFLETVFNAIQEGIIVTDSSGRITYLTTPPARFSASMAKVPSGNNLTNGVGASIGTAAPTAVGPLPRTSSFFSP